MYRILLADDEGIMLQSLENIISTAWKNECEIEKAKTGRLVVELAETFRPDIVFMDIQMPGINGIEAMKEIRKFNSSAVFIVISAYDKFVYAKESINLGVLEYLTKPVNKNTIIAVVKRAIELIDRERKRRSDLLKVKEKLETATLIIESGFLYHLLLQDADGQDLSHYKELLDMKEDYGYMMVLQFGDAIVNGQLTNKVGISVKAQSFYMYFREIVKESFHCMVSSVMANKIAVYVPVRDSFITYEERIRIIESSRIMVRKLEQRIDARFKCGIGKVRITAEAGESYREAIKAMSENSSRVSHAEDLPFGSRYEGEYPVETENRLFQMLVRSDLVGVKDAANEFFDWMEQNYKDYPENIRIKVLEFVMRAEREAFLNGGMDYGFHYRKDYLSVIMSLDDYDRLRSWFLLKLEEVCRTASGKREAETESLVMRAKSFMNENFHKNISLEDVSRAVNISPYYFSKLFKDENGEKFIEYLTRIRISHAKELLAKPEYSIKEICVNSGYGDPNYFSRIFKKYEGVTPSEFRAKL